MSEHKVTYEEFLTDLKALHEEEFSCKEFYEKYLSKYKPVDTQNLPDLVGNLGHYIDDEDLRAKDPEYKKMQNSELFKLINLVEKKASLEVMREIHFLGYSD